MKPIHKLLIAFSIVLTLLVGAVNAQEVKAHKAYTYSTESLAIGKGTVTTKYINDKTGKHFIYEGPKGGLYYIVKNKQGEYVRRSWKP
jgi:hypothetical protein